MRTRIVTTGAVALLLCACQNNNGAGGAPNSPAGQTAASAPGGSALHRQPGLWQMRVSIQDGGVVQTREICLDAGAEPKVALWGAQAKSRCSRDSVEAQPDGSFTISASCDQGALGRVEVSGSMTGDPAKAYSVHIRKVTTGAANYDDNGSLEINTEFSRIGPCRPGQAGGELEVNGTRRNVLAPK